MFLTGFLFDKLQKIYYAMLTLLKEGYRTLKKIFILSGPAGSGKTTICNWLCARTEPFTHVTRLFAYIKSATTRRPRYDESNLEYMFVTDEDFQRMFSERALLWKKKTRGAYYGTLKCFAITAVTSHADQKWIVALTPDKVTTFKKYAKKTWPDFSPTLIHSIYITRSRATLRERLKDRKSAQEVRVALGQKRRWDRFAEKNRGVVFDEIIDEKDPRTSYEIASYLTESAKSSRPQHRNRARVHAGT